MEYDPLTHPGDRMDLMGARLASIRVDFRDCAKSDEELTIMCNELERSLLEWAEQAQAAGSACSYRSVRDVSTTNAFNGVRHEYRTPRAFRFWNKWRCFRILLSRMQESMWRRSWPTLAQPALQIPNSEYYRTIRARMMTEICTAAASVLGNDSTATPTTGSLSNGYIITLPLSIAGTCLLETLAEPIVSPGGSRMIVIDKTFHLDLFNSASTQLAWIIARLDYIGQKVGIQWACAMSKLLSGGCNAYYDLSRS